MSVLLFLFAAPFLPPLLSLKKNKSTEIFEPTLREDAQRAFPVIAFPFTEQVASLSVKEKNSKIKKISSQGHDSWGRAVSLTLTGRELIREELVRKGKPLLRISLRGNARLYHNQIRVRAQRIVIENEERGEMTGNIEIYDPRTKTRVYGQSATYERGKQRIRLWGNPYIQKSSSTHTQLLITCQNLDYLLEERHLLLEGGVRGHYRDGNMFAEQGKYLASQQKLILETDPTFWSPRAYLIGKTLIFEEQKQSFEIRRGECSLLARLCFPPSFLYSKQCRYPSKKTFLS